jgi:hypothetical protein
MESVMARISGKNLSNVSAFTSMLQQVAMLGGYAVRNHSKTTAKGKECCAVGMPTDYYAGITRKGQFD